MQETDSGLQIQFLKFGNGQYPDESDIVKCNYIFKLENGAEFDNSYKIGRPVTFRINQIIEGFKEALLLMPVGSEVNLIIPPDSAYGKKGVYPHIKPNSTLFYKLMLHSIE